MLMPRLGSTGLQVAMWIPCFQDVHGLLVSDSLHGPLISLWLCFPGYWTQKRFIKVLSNLWQLANPGGRRGVMPVCSRSCWRTFRKSTNSRDLLAVAFRKVISFFLSPGVSGPGTSLQADEGQHLFWFNSGLSYLLFRKQAHFSHRWMTGMGKEQEAGRSHTSWVLPRAWNATHLPSASEQLPRDIGG